MPSGDVALFVDWENLQLPPDVSKADRLKSLAEEHGRLVLARAYGDWAQRPKGAQEQYELYVAGIEPVYVPCKNSEGGVVKNSVDVKMSADCLEFTHLCPNIRTYVLASCDADFLHVAQSLRRRGLNVVVLGKTQAVSSRLVAASDGAVFYDASSVAVGTAESEKSKGAKCSYKLKTVDKALREILTKLEQEGKKGYPQALGGLKSLLKARLPRFDEGEYGPGKFGDFVREREKAGVLTIVRKGDSDHAMLPK
ncbi:NYN domain-containing protein [bacterium]|nr:MAG: NYN domain-containing protein [bacterium]